MRTSSSEYQACLTVLIMCGVQSTLRLRLLFVTLTLGGRLGRQLRAFARIPRWLGHLTVFRTQQVRSRLSVELLYKSKGFSRQASGFSALHPVNLPLHDWSMHRAMATLKGPRSLCLLILWTGVALGRHRG